LRHGHSALGFGLSALRLQLETCAKASESRNPNALFQELQLGPRDQAGLGSLDLINHG
jgi:hypothetical protein